MKKPGKNRVNRKLESRHIHPQASVAARYVVEVVPGLEKIASQELKDTLDPVPHVQSGARAGELILNWSGNTEQFYRLRMIQAVYEALEFDIPRPKALMGHQNLRIVINTVQKHQTQEQGSFRSIALSAAGKDSTTMQRLLQELSTATGLKPEPEQGDLLLRLRPSPAGKGWQVLVRTSPRPIATRSWRVCDLRGALNATVARAIAHMAAPRAQHHCLNLACGSGTIMIELSDLQPDSHITGIDISEEHLKCATANIVAAGKDPLQLLQANATRTPFPTHSFDRLYADLPFGQAIGSHNENRILYPQILLEAARIAKPDAILALITHEIRLLEHTLHATGRWAVQQTQQITLRGLHPKIYILKRKN